MVLCILGVMAPEPNHSSQGFPAARHSPTKEKKIVGGVRSGPGEVKEMIEMEGLFCFFKDTFNPSL